MLALTQAARLYRRVGQRGGKPAYAGEGIAFRCRTQPKDARTVGSRGFGGGRTVLIFSEDAQMGAGDRIVLEDGSALTVRQVKVVRGYARVHHLEIEAATEG